MIPNNLHVIKIYFVFCLIFYLFFKGIDLEKFQEFETEAQNVLNGHVNIYENSESEVESQNENSKDTPKSISEINNSKSENMEISNEEEKTNDKIDENVSSNSSSRRESIDDLSFAIESDSSLTNVETSEKILVDKNELENALQHTVRVTKDLPIEVLCDIYVQLSRCVGRYARAYDRKSLPKVILYLNISSFF